MEIGFLSLKGSSGRGVKEKSEGSIDVSAEVTGVMPSDADGPVMVDENFISVEGLDAMFENGLWFILKNLLILKKCIPDVNLLKEDVGNVPVWVKLHYVLVTAFSEDGLSVIASKIGTPLMLDSYTFDMCIQSWGKLSYVKALINVRDDVELKDNIVDDSHKNKASDVVKNMKKPSQTPRGVPVGPKNVKSSSPSTTLIIEKFDKMERLIIDRTVSLIDDEDVGYCTNSILEQWKESYGDVEYDYNLYDDDMYEGQDIPDKIQDICDNLDVKV
uniref:Uncharacterized protein n=1 Tax=Tanacetum cinerariifolium TaxID=118510 RepID=A0A6L2LEH6_TANCI|nr:hypothetical protein [Tanacetum cinerariifolium]